MAYLKNNPGCIYTLNNTSVTGLNLGGSALIFLDAPHCSMYINSTSNSSGLASGFIDEITAKSIGIVGNPGYNAGGFTFFGTRPVGRNLTVSDPLGYLTPPCLSDTSCGCLPSKTNVKVTSLTTLQPGNYCGTTVAGVHNAAITVTSAALVTFAPGLYNINGGLSLGNVGAPASGGLNLTGSAFVSGQGVTFYLYNGASFNVAGTGIQLTAPGPNAAAGIPGVLFYQERGSAFDAGRLHPHTRQFASHHRQYRQLSRSRRRHLCAKRVSDFSDSCFHHILELRHLRGRYHHLYWRAWDLH